MCAASVSVFGNENITPLTCEIVTLIQNSGRNFNELNYYLSKPFTLVVSEQYDVPRIDIQNGSLIMPDKGQKQTIVFSGDQQGRLHGFPVSGSEDIFEVIFQVENREIPLKFRKNRQNYFELFSALIDTRPYTLSSDLDLPKLAITSNIVSSGGANRFIEGKGSLDKSKIIAYIKSRNSAINEAALDTLISVYLQEAAIENINHDIAVAQMLYATSFLKGGKFVSAHNYGGLLELPTWNGCFANMTDGVRAHIQHIKGYASVTMNNSQIIDPRYYLLVNLNYLGTVKTFDQLYEKWTANHANYKNNIEIILNGLYN